MAFRSKLRDWPTRIQSSGRRARRSAWTSVNLVVTFSRSLAVTPLYLEIVCHQIFFKNYKFLKEKDFLFSSRLNLTGYISRKVFVCLNLSITTKTIVFLYARDAVASIHKKCNLIAK